MSYAPMTDTSDELRVPCPHCQTMVLVGARKCRGCRKWLEPASKPRRSVFGRAMAALCAVAVSAASAFVLQHETAVGEAPPLTQLPGAAPAAAAMQDDPPAALGPSPEEEEATEPLVLDDDSLPELDWRARNLHLDVHPLDLAFSDDGKTLYVSCDDATLRAYDVATGKLRHMAAVPAQGDRIKVLFGRYVAILHLHNTAHVPVMDTHNWDRDPILLWVGANPADIVGLPDGKTVVTASRLGKRLSAWDLSSARRLADIRLPHATRELHLLHIDDRPYIGAMGILRRGGRTAGAWIDLFDPAETPFGATRRSVAVGRDPRGTVAANGKQLFFVDHAANSASMLALDQSGRPKSVPVGRAPISAHLMHDGKFGVTLDAEAGTATVLDAARVAPVSTITLPGSPSHGAVSPDSKWLFVALGGAKKPARDRGVAILADDPLRVVKKLDTSVGASRVAVSPTGTKAAVVNYLGRSITFVEAAR